MRGLRRAAPHRAPGCRPRPPSPLSASPERGPRRPGRHDCPRAVGPGRSPACRRRCAEGRCVRAWPGRRGATRAHPPPLGFARAGARSRRVWSWRRRPTRAPHVVRAARRGGSASGRRRGICGAWRSACTGWPRCWPTPHRPGGTFQALKALGEAIARGLRGPRAGGAGARGLPGPGARGLPGRGCPPAQGAAPDYGVTAKCRRIAAARSWSPSVLMRSVTESTVTRPQARRT